MESEKGTYPALTQTLKHPIASAYACIQKGGIAISNF